MSQQQQWQPEDSGAMAFKVLRENSFESRILSLKNKLVFRCARTPKIYFPCTFSEVVTSRWKSKKRKIKFKKWLRTYLVVQWLRIHLPMQGTQVRALVWEDPTCRRATKPVCHNYWACALEPTSHNYWVHLPQLLRPMLLEPVLHNKEKPPQWEACGPQRRVASAASTRESPRAATKTQSSQKLIN